MVRKKRLFSFLYNKAACKISTDLTEMSSTTPSTIKKREAQLIHALIVIFLEYFSWGLLTVPVINVCFLIFLFLIFPFLTFLYLLSLIIYENFV